jgi:hypothetical protein
MTTISEYIKDDQNMVLGTAIRETAKAIGFKIDGSKQIAWFPKSKSILLKDDFYAHPQDKWAVPGWMVQSRASEIGVLPHWIGG